MQEPEIAEDSQEENVVSSSQVIPNFRPRQQYERSYQRSRSDEDDSDSELLLTAVLDQLRMARSAPRSVEQLVQDVELAVTRNVNLPGLKPKALPKALSKASPHMNDPSENEDLPEYEEFEDLEELRRRSARLEQQYEEEKRKLELASYYRHALEIENEQLSARNLMPYTPTEL